MHCNSTDEFVIGINALISQFKQNNYPKNKYTLPVLTI